MNWAQSSASQELEDERLNDLLNYVPKNFVIDSSSKPISNIFNTRLHLNTIGGLYAIYNLRGLVIFEKSEIEWLNKQIDQISVAFYLEGKPILIEKTGGYEGCGGKLVDQKNLNGKEVTTINFCFGCSGADPHIDEFMEIFNNRTKKLLLLQ